MDKPVFGESQRVEISLNPITFQAPYKSFFLVPVAEVEYYSVKREMLRFFLSTGFIFFLHIRLPNPK